MVGKILASGLVTAVCIYYALHGVDRTQVMVELRALPTAGVLLYLLTLMITHLFRSWRWEYLLRPVGVSLPLRRLVPISSVGFMAILALPMRLGEFVRPYYVAREGHVRMSAALGTVAVERIIDGLMISLLFFGSYLASAHSMFSPELRAGAWLSLGAFVALTTFLALALLRTDATIALLLKATLLQRFAPARAAHVADKVRSLITGFRVLGDGRNLALFLGQTIAYWGCNGLGMWVLARYMGLPISLGAAFATMAFTGVVLSLPNAPGLVGQFHAGVKMALGAYLPLAVVNSKGMAYAIVLHGLQTVWYVTAGVVSLMILSGNRSGGLRGAVRAANHAAESPEVEPAA
ncbi:MAG: lysylphosphatidylglycerol synthase transmembrane domain-containing protein [Myxococcales bacterium]